MLTTISMGAGSWSEWTDDVLNVIRLMEITPGTRFNLQKVYGSETLLKRIHPENNHIQAKIRQQLQILQEHGYVRFVDNRGNYEMLK
jgi:type II restriction enzyme